MDIFGLKIQNKQKALTSFHQESPSFAQLQNRLKVTTRNFSTKTLKTELKTTATE